MPRVCCYGLMILMACSSDDEQRHSTEAKSPDDARAFLARAEAELGDLSVASARAAWIQANFITHDTEALAAKAAEALTAAGVRFAMEAAHYEGVELGPVDARKMYLLRQSLTLPAPPRPESLAELSRIATGLESAYGRGRYCPQPSSCRDLAQLSEVMDHSRDPAALLDAWVGWRTIAPSMRDDYARLIELANAGAGTLGYSSVGTLWRSKYDMPPEAFAVELERLWSQIKPLYDALHCHVRARLNATYGDAVVPTQGPIPAHVLGNMWAQAWGNIYDLVRPSDQESAIDLTARLANAQVDAVGLVRMGERFFTSLGFAPLPETFWERSLFTKPRDRDVLCHASAWDVESGNDLRIKMCIKVDDEDFFTVHHELGHNFYQRAYAEQPYLFRGSANDGFHEAVGDAVALSATPSYLRKIGLIDAEPPVEHDVSLLLKQALDKVAFLPFGLLVDKWRWQVFAGETTPDTYNQAWWDLRKQYQGIVPPVPRSEKDFDPGAKFHVPANVPYARYFLAHVLQFQFHRALCDAAGNEGPLHRCSIYDSKAAGERLAAMMALGQSQPWPEALEVLTGTRNMDASAMLDYFAPLKAWLDNQNQGRTCGW